MNVRVLNEGSVPQQSTDPEIAARLRGAMQQLKVDFFDQGRGRVDYAAMRQSAAYRRYAEESVLLQSFAPDQLGSRQEKLAFWINLYNTLVIHGVIELGILDSIKEEGNFFHRIAYRIGGMLFTPDDIEHGLLRGNRHPPHGLFSPFGHADPRLTQVLEPPDPRIHFALSCASASCPAIQYYTPERIDAQLDLAAAGFINGPEVEVLPRENLLRLSPIFKWYRPDFGGHEGVVDMLIHYIDHGEAKDFLLERGMAADVEWKAYDWSLNKL